MILCPTAVAPDHPDSYYSVTARLAEEIPGAFHPDQYHNPENPASHEATTGPEIWRQTAGRVSHFVAGIGTGGTICGIGRYLKSQNPDVQIVGADPEGSVYSGGSGRPYLVEGIGEDFWPTTYDPSVVDRVVMVSDTDSFLTARRLAVDEGILAGGSTGTAVWAALQLAPDLRRDDVVVVLVPDSGRGYLSKLYNDEWMADHGFLRTSGHTVADLLERKGGRLPGMIHVHPDETARQAVAVMAEYDVSQIAVIQAEPPLAAAEVVGAVQEHHLMQRALHDPGLLDRSVAEIMGPPLPSVGSGETVDNALRRLEESPAVVVLDNGHPGRRDHPIGRARVPGPGRLVEGGALNSSNDRDGTGPGVRDTGDPCRPGPRSAHRRGRHADPPRLHLRPGGRGQAQGLRLRAHAQPDPRVARDHDRVARGGEPRLRVLERHGGRGRRSPPLAGRATTC